jgi:hypothetical protein
MRQLYVSDDTQNYNLRLSLDGEFISALLTLDLVRSPFQQGIFTGI